MLTHPLTPSPTDVCSLAKFVLDITDELHPHLFMLSLHLFHLVQILYQNVILLIHKELDHDAHVVRGGLGSAF